MEEVDRTVHHMQDEALIRLIQRIVQLWKKNSALNCELVTGNAG